MEDIFHLYKMEDGFSEENYPSWYRIWGMYLIFTNYIYLTSCSLRYFYSKEIRFS